MSRKFRKEEERVLQIKEEEKVDLDNMKLAKLRIYGPIVWKRMATGFRIEDIKEKHFQEVLDLLKEHYLDDDVLCRNSRMSEDEISTRSFLDRCLFQLKDTSSIMAVDESSFCPRVSIVLEPRIQLDVSETEEIAGVVLLRVIHKEDFGRVFSRTVVVNGEAQRKCAAIKSALNRRADVYEMFECESYLRVYVVCVKPKYRRKGIGFELMRCAVSVARSMHVPVIMGIFGNGSIQKYGRKLGMQAVAEINYVDWLDEHKNLVFDDPGPGNYTCALYAGRVPRESSPEKLRLPIVIAAAPEKEEGPTKSTRQERREAARRKKPQ